MNRIYLINYSVRGIKNIDTLVTLYFYKKTIGKNPDVQNYNVKSIYGVNGSGKSGIIKSVEILKNLISDSTYLKNPITQKKLQEIVNKKTQELFIQTDYLVNTGRTVIYYRYEIILKKDENKNYVVFHEQLLSRNAFSEKDGMKTIFKISNGEIVELYEKERDDKVLSAVYKKTMNLLLAATMSSLFKKNIDMPGNNFQEKGSRLLSKMEMLCVFGENLHICMDESDESSEYTTGNFIGYFGNMLPKSMYQHFEKMVDGLFTFLHIFKPELESIEIEKKENGDMLFCKLILVYDAYKIYAEYESAGIKKLIKLYAYLKEMVQGGIVFIDELDSDLHEVYLCALLEYLTEYGKGQLCFTTHDVGLMDILKQRKMSIDFLTEDHKMHSWKKNGNYSPSKLYKSGMMEGSPFNIDSIDFIGIFGSGE